MSQRDRRWLVAIVAVGALLRIAWIVYANRPPVTLIDPSFYTLYADRIADGHGYTLPDGSPTAYYPPGYPIALGVVVWVVRLVAAGDDVAAIAGWFNLLLGLATIVLVFELARRVFDDTRTGLVAAAVVALWPNLVFHTAVALTETLFNLLVVAALLVLVGRGWHDRPSTRRLVGFGLLLGASILVRPISVFLVLALVWAWARPAGWGWRWALTRGALVTAAAFVVIVPWTIRNVRAMDAPVLISTNFGDNFCIGHHEGAKGGFSLTPDCFAGDFNDLERPEFEIERNSVTARRGIEYLLDHPIDEVRLVGWRAVRTFENDHDAVRAAESYGADAFMSDGARTAWKAAANVFYAVVGLVAVAGLFLVDRRRDPRRSLLLWSMVALIVPPLAFFGDPRFKLPVVPFLAVLAAVTVVRLSRPGSAPR